MMLIVAGTHHMMLRSRLSAYPLRFFPPLRKKLERRSLGYEASSILVTDVALFSYRVAAKLPKQRKFSLDFEIRIIEDLDN